MLIKYKTTKSLQTQKFIPFSHMEQIKHLPLKTVHLTMKTVKKPTKQKTNTKRKKKKRKKPHRPTEKECLLKLEIHYSTDFH